MTAFTWATKLQRSTGRRISIITNLEQLSNNRTAKPTAEGDVYWKLIVKDETRLTIWYPKIKRSENVKLQSSMEEKQGVSKVIPMQNQNYHIGNRDTEHISVRRRSEETGITLPRETIQWSWSSIIHKTKNSALSVWDTPVSIAQSWQQALVSLSRLNSIVTCVSHRCCGYLPVGSLARKLRRD